MATFQITANGTTMGDYVGATEDEAIAAYVRDAGYASIDDAADACGQSVEAFRADIVCAPGGEASAQTNSIGISKWAGEQAIECTWSVGEGDARLTGWTRADGERAIETNGDPVFEGDDGFEDAWAARGLESEE